MSPVISLDGAGKVYGSNSALEAVSATIHPGQFVAIIGRSGGGKTTLLRCRRAPPRLRGARSASGTSTSRRCTAAPCVRTAGASA